MADLDTQPVDTQSKIIDTSPDVMARIALLGFGLGVVLWLATLIFSQFILAPIFCQNDGNVGICANKDVIAGNIALVITAISGMLGLVRLGVYRPMLIAVAVLACLWGIGGWLSGIAWYEALGWSALLSAVAYVAFSWFVRLRNFIVVVVALAIFLILIRFITTL